MFLTKNAILNDVEFLQALANTIYHRFGVKGLENILLNIQSDTPDWNESYQVRELLTHNLLNHAKETNRFDEYINNFFDVLDKSSNKDVILEKFSIMLETHRIEIKKKSNQPWVEVVGDYYDEDEKRMKISFDWNDAFIKLLKQKGYPGENEDELVQMWLQEIANQR
jgi:hypothetical protein